MMINTSTCFIVIVMLLNAYPECLVMYAEVWQGDFLTLLALFGNNCLDLVT